MPGQKPDDPTVHEETDSPTYADDQMFYKVEKWTRDGTKVVTACFMPATASVEHGQCSKGLSSIGLEPDHPTANTGPGSMATTEWLTQAHQP
jgi:hypothetical protein